MIAAFLLLRFRWLVQERAAAILDRLLHHSVTSNIRGEPYRLQDKRKAGIFRALEAPVER